MYLVDDHERMEDFELRQSHLVGRPSFVRTREGCLIFVA